MQENSNQQIEPEAFSPAQGKGPVKPSGQESNTFDQTDKTTQKSVLTWAIPAFLVVIALLVLVVPAVFKNNPEKPSIPTTDNSAQIEQIITSNTPEETPWADAQLLKARRDTQEILSEFLGVQKRLESMRVDQWALDELNTIKLTAKEGDNLYKERLFGQSLEKYTEALNSALGLDASVPVIAREYQEQGRLLLGQNQSTNALAALEISNLLMPDVELTLELLGQTNAREKILLLMDQSNTLARNGSSQNDHSLEEAKQLLVDALALDASYTPLTSLMDEVDQKILERDFREQMSRGFTALGSGYYQQATGAFNQATQLKPNESAPLEALQQVEAAKLNTQRQASLDRALELEANEQWEAALTTYSSLLKEDGSLTAAQLGKLRSRARFNLDSDIGAIINKPLALQSEKKWQSASKTFADARGIINAGERLNTQVELLQKLLLIARTPVVLKLNSDGLTNIEIYKVGKLGTFTEQAMNLNPGKYVIVGQRNGYQDVRVELSIDGSQSEITVPIICTVII